ncbi:hypothetical protein KBD08_04040 [Candidatus Babeliales bacterium]|nr:hypothetical protein [Candidatus Babeliales bacterium]
MEPKRHSKEKMLLHKLGSFPQNIATNHYLENLSEFVLHELCSQDLFNLPKAAYLVNNPDFKCLKGVAGYDDKHAFNAGVNWQKHKEFTSHMKQSPFNQKVRLMYDSALSKHDENEMYALADVLEIEHPVYHIWDMKHENQGIFIYEKPESFDETHEHLIQFVPMLSFCPVF